MHFKIVKTYDEPFECEDCGSCYPEGLYVEYNDVIVWEKFSDGHYSGHQTEDSILNSILTKWLADSNAELEIAKTEEKRHEWNKKSPGNGIARTPESWKEYHENGQSYIDDMFEQMKENCENLPYEEILQVKMIALWFESVTGEKVTIEVTEERYSDIE